MKFTTATLFTLCLLTQAPVLHAMRPAGAPEGRFNAPQTRDEAIAQDIAIADAKQRAHERALQPSRNVECKSNAQRAQEFDWSMVQREDKTEEEADTESQLLPKKFKSTEKAAHDSGFDCTGFPTELQNLVKEYAIDPLDFFPILATRRILPYSEYQKYNAKTLILSNNRKAVIKGNAVHIIDAKSGDLLRELSGHAAHINSMVLFQNNLVIVSDDATVLIWDLETDKCSHLLMDNARHYSFHEVFNIRDRYIMILAWSRDGMSLVNTARIWDTEAQKWLPPLQISAYELGSTKLLPNGNIATCDGIRTVTIWNPITSKKIRTITADSAYIQVTQEGFLITAYSKYLKVWDPMTGTCLKTITLPKDSLIHRFHLLPNGHLAIHTYEYVFIWDLATGLCKNILQGPRLRFMTAGAIMPPREHAIIFDCPSMTHGGYKYEADEESLKILYELSPAERENLKKLLLMLNQLTLKQLRTSVQDPEELPIGLFGEVGELFATMPPHIQERLRAHYRLTDDINNAATDQFDPHPVEIGQETDCSGCCSPCVIL
jgi:hypothetical protein